MKNKLVLFHILVLVVALLGVGGLRANAQATQPAAKIPLTFFVGYIRNVQFAPLYWAIERGYFADAGFDVKVEHSYNETDGLARIGVNRLQFGLISGEQVILARAQGAPVVYVASWYQKFPVGVVASKASGITSVKDLVGKNVGVPGKYGASYIGFRAMLAAANLSETDLKSVQEIGFDTAPILCNGKVDAAVVYIVNEPYQIEQKCFPVQVISIADSANLVGNGIITNEATLTDHPDWVRSITAAFLRALGDVIKDPDAAYQICKKYIENLGDDPIQKQVLQASITLWAVPEGGVLGQIDDARWKLTQDTLLAMKLIDAPIELEKAYTRAFLPE